MPTEEQVKAGAIILAESPMIDSPKLASPSWRGLARAVLEAAERVADAHSLGRDCPGCGQALANYCPSCQKALES
jgi:hypothetical protein